MRGFAKTADQGCASGLTDIESVVLVDASNLRENEACVKMMLWQRLGPKAHVELPACWHVRGNTITIVAVPHTGETITGG